MFKRRRKKQVLVALETNLPELKALMDKLKSLVSRTENKQTELKKKVSEYESLVKQTENTIKEINKFKLKTKIKRGDE